MTPEIIISLLDGYGPLGFGLFAVIALIFVLVWALGKVKEIAGPSLDTLLEILVTLKAIVPDLRALVEANGDLVDKQTYSVSRIEVVEGRIEQAAERLELAAELLERLGRNGGTQ